ncbi:Zn-dependent protease with chaperone function [Actinokineospora terrae]|uniref:Zn-dependent protease with chaperone function n=1 Tax=Actinokineospora terrae TaxID=155974 RepID=A0A1H9LNG1_9PSEU|nr:Zn-dependent protease with chaperone function [Actinokineospora terrae]
MAGAGVPAGTTFRFLTLVGIAVAITAYVADHFASLTGADRGLARLRCQVVSGVYPDASVRIEPDESKWNSYYDCLYALRGTQLLWLGGALALLALVTWLFYVAQPVWRIRRGRLVLLRDVPALWARLEPTLTELTRKAGLAALPEFRLDPGSTRAGGVAFGTHRRSVVCLDVGLVLLHDRDRPAFDAVVLHELAHLRHRDVPITYATIAVWRAVLLVAVLPLTVALVRSLLVAPDPVLWVLLVWAPLLVLLAHVARASVLRVREHHADLLVVEWTGDNDPFRTLPEVRSPRFTSHPSRAARLAVTRDPRVLLRPGFLAFFLGGLTWQVVANTAGMALGALWLRSDSAGPAVLRLAWSAGAAALVGVAAWRGAEHVRLGGGRALLLPGLGIGLGLGLGGLVVPMVALDPMGLQFAPLTFALRAVGVVVAVLVCAWAGWCVSLARTRFHRAAVAVAVVVVCWSCLGWLPSAYGYAGLWDWMLAPALERLGDIAGGGVDAVLLGAAALPLFADVDRVLTTVALGLVWLVPALLGRPPRAAFTVGAAGMAVVAIAVLVIGGADPLVATAWQLAAVAVVQLAVAWVARRSGVVAAVVAAWLTGVAGCLAIWAAHWSAGEVDAVLARQPMRVLPFTALVAAALVAVVGRRRVAARPVRRVALIPVVVLTAAVLVPFPVATSSAVALLPRQPATGIVDPRRALFIWARGGGMALLSDVGQAQSRALLGMAEDDRAAQVARCEELLDRIRVAREYPDPPEPVARGHWNSGMDASRLGARECVRIFSGPDGDPNPVSTAFTAAADDFLPLLRAISDVATAVPPEPPAPTTSTPPPPPPPPPPVDLATMLLTAADLPRGAKEKPPSTGGSSSDIRTEPSDCGVDVGPPELAKASRTFDMPDGSWITASVYRYPEDGGVTLRMMAENYAHCHQYRVFAGDIKQKVTIDVVSGAPLVADITFDGGFVVLHSRQVWILKGELLACVSVGGKRRPDPSFVDSLAATVTSRLVTR